MLFVFLLAISSLEIQKVENNPISHNVSLKIFFLRGSLKDSLDSSFLLQQASSLLREKFRSSYLINLQHMGHLEVEEEEIFRGLGEKEEGSVEVEKLKMLSEYVEEMKRSIREDIQENSIKDSIEDIQENSIEDIEDSTKLSYHNLLESDLVVLLSSKEGGIEGASFIGGCASQRDGYSLLHLSKGDSLFYKGKVLAHEILHSLGASHHKNSLMAESFNPEKKEEEVEINQETIREVEEFMKRHEED